MRTRDIIVGTDGTEPGRSAVRWAAREAAHQGLLLRIVHVLDGNWSAAQDDYESWRLNDHRKLAEMSMAMAKVEAWEAAPAVEIETDFLIGHPAARLVAISDGAEALVVGNRGRGGIAGLLLGSVGRRVATHAGCPVVVVRGRADVAAGPVVAGIDEPDRGDPVFEAAFEAAAPDTPLTVIHNFRTPIMAGGADVAVVPATTPSQEDLLRAWLEERLGPWRAKYPDVPVEIRLSRDTAAAALTAASHDARLVVVGSRGHGVLAGTLLGSTVLQLLQHAGCPVQVVRPRGFRWDS